MLKIEYLCVRTNVRARVCQQATWLIGTIVYNYNYKIVVYISRPINYIVV